MQMLLIFPLVVVLLHGIPGGAQGQQDPSFEIEYVIEPFEHFVYVTNPSQRANESVLEMGEGLFESGAAQFVLSSNITIPVRIEQAETDSRHQRHNCIGATRFSLWCRANSTQENLRVSLSFQVSACAEYLQENCESQEFKLLNTRNLTSTLLESDGEWHELSWEINDQKDTGLIEHLDQLKGWAISVGSSKDNGTDTNETLMRSSVVLIDQLSCKGGGDLFGAAFKTTESFETAIARITWDKSSTDEQLLNDTKIELVDGQLVLDPYFVEHTEVWGGYLGMNHVSPFSSYYNLSGATSLSLGYDVLKPVVPERVHLRINLFDVADCEHFSCRYDTQEHFYSFHHSVLPIPGPGVVNVTLEGDASWDLPFVFTGWSGRAGNKLLDLSSIKGFRLEINIGDDGVRGTVATGAVALGPLSVAKENIALETRNDCQQGETIALKRVPENFQPVGHERDCCGRCADNDDCQYAISGGTTCYLASHIESGVVALRGDIHGSLQIFSFLTAEDYCDVCRCDEGTESIDCSGRDLRALPSTFGKGEAKWSPRSLDLRDNPKLAFVGASMLQPIANSLEELWLSDSVDYLSPTAIRGSSSLSAVRTNPSIQESAQFQNVIVGDRGIFGDVCCGRGDKVTMALPDEDLTFCSIETDTIGIDAEFLPFARYYEAGELRYLRPTSDFMSEASESPKMCAEYCSISSECRYFTYDQRIMEAEHTCLLLRNNGTDTAISCCEDYHYRDEAKSGPGLVSGWPAQTRHEHGARVVFSHTDVVLEQGNDYTTQYSVSLGSMPKRGAVWITPTIVSSTSLEVDISPRTVALYDNTTVVTVTVLLRNRPVTMGDGETVVLVNTVQSCDRAFSSASSDIEISTFIHVEFASPTNQVLRIVAPVVATAIFFIVGAVVFAVGQRRKTEAAFWEVSLSELVFPAEPQVLGKGTFGLVVLAEYRGTEVAVKRALPKATATTATAKDSVNEEHAVFENGTSSQGRNSVIMHIPKGNSTMTSSIAMRTKSSVHLKQSFKEEMHHLATLRHPCVTTVLGAVIEKESELMLVMEYMQNGSLYDILHNHTMALEGDIILPILRDVSQGMRFLHSASPLVLHGDLKAQNILVDSKFRGKVADFGLTQKQSLGVSGTKYWMAPELLRGESMNTTMSDVYSFGIILFEVYSRQDPYEGEQYGDVIAQIVDSTICKRPPIPDSCPAKIQTLTKECLLDCPSHRPTFEELDLQLKRLESFMVDPKGKTSNDQTERLLLEVFPKRVADALKEGRPVKPESKDMVTIFFSDIVNFTQISSLLSPMKISEMLGRLYTKLDELSKKHDVFKVETIGDAYMAVTNLHHDQPDHAKRIAEFSVEAIAAANSTLIDEDDPSQGCVHIRVGFHSGPVVANVVGTRNPRYCLFGNTVNVASRMESNSEQDRIHCSEASATILSMQEPSIHLQSRGVLDIKGKGDMLTFWVNKNDTGYSSDSQDFSI